MLQNIDILIGRFLRVYLQVINYCYGNTHKITAEFETTIKKAHIMHADDADDAYECGEVPYHCYLKSFEHTTHNVPHRV